MSVGAWALEVLGSGVLSATLLAVAGWLFKQQINNWLNRDLERIKAKHQRELEAYKVSLIAEAEKAKAESELKKAGALKIIEKRFNAIDRLHSASLGNVADFLSTAILAPQQKTVDEYRRIKDRLEELKRCIQAAEVFLNRDQRELLLAYRSALVDLHVHCFPDTQVLQGEERKAIEDQIFKAEIKVDDLLREEIERMMGMR